MSLPLEAFAPIFQSDTYSGEERYCLSPFFTNLNRSVYAPLIFAPELIGALCSLTSRAAEDLRYLFYHRYVKPFIYHERAEKDTDESYTGRVRYGSELFSFISFLHDHPIEVLFSNPSARAFYLKWLAEYGDDSIAQMAGCHLVFSGLSQIAIKHFEDQRIGLAPIEKSTRFVDYSQKINGCYRYYTDPTLAAMGLEKEYREAMDRLFNAYTTLRQPLIEWLSRKFPEEKPLVIEKKAFDTLRGLLPLSTLSQVAFFGNGQAFEYMVNRSNEHALGEIRWAANQAYQELNNIVPAFLRRLRDEDKQQIRDDYQRYLAERKSRMEPFAHQYLRDAYRAIVTPAIQADIQIAEIDPVGEENVIAAMLYDAPGNHRSWKEIQYRVLAMTKEQKQEIVAAYFHGRGKDIKDRWQKVGRALENTYVRVEIAMNIGAWRDLHRHRMKTQQRQDFSPYHGYDISQEIIDAGLENQFRASIDPIGDLYERIARHDGCVAQYCVPMAYRMRFQQYLNLRALFWEIELRTIPEGHPDYRFIEQEIFKKLQPLFPILFDYMKVNLAHYDFARRGQAEKIAQKQEKLAQQNTLGLSN